MGVTLFTELLTAEVSSNTPNKSSVPMISIVDDDESVREALESLLKSVGYRAEVFASAQEFLRLGQHQDSRCLILDVRMPGLSGLELQRQLVSSGPSIPIIFITAHGDEAARAQALGAGAVAFLRKPFTEEALLKAVDAALA
jgi:FixJ family two-component response regulator